MKIVLPWILLFLAACSFSLEWDRYSKQEPILLDAEKQEPVQTQENSSTGQDSLLKRKM